MIQITIQKLFSFSLGSNLGLGAILLFAPATFATAVVPEPTLPLVVAQEQFANPKFAGFDQQPRFCDLRLANGWFYWYRQSPRNCTVVLSSNQADATVKAQELAESSDVTEAGIGYRLFGDPFF
jgi:hypothetical protein